MAATVEPAIDPHVLYDLVEVQLAATVRDDVALLIEVETRATEEPVHLGTLGEALADIRQLAVRVAVPVRVLDRSLALC